MNRPVVLFDVRNSKIEVIWVMKQRKQNIQAPKRAVALTGDGRATLKNKAIASVVNKIKYRIKEYKENNYGKNHKICILAGW